MRRAWLFLLPLGLVAGEDPHSHNLGKVHFPISCSQGAQGVFDHGLALLHSFWYDQAERTFSEAARIEPSCAMAYWGIAMSFYHPVWAPPGAKDLRKGAAAVARANAASRKTQRESDYIAAIGAYYRDGEKTSPRQRALAWRNAMEQVSAKYPEDTEAAIFFALGLIATAPQGDKTYANQKRAAGILNGILPQQPEHPGIAHYMIHSYDSPPLAILALPAARTYARIAPAAAHALHMPSHIFTRLGLWQDSIDSNVASAATAKSFVAKTMPGAVSQDQLHAMDYLEYAYLQTCRDADARRVVEEAAGASKLDQEVFQAAYALAAIPARFTLERRRWSAAAELRVAPAWFPWGDFQFAEAITYFARAVGAARSGNSPAARGAIDRLAAIRKALAQGPLDYDWAAQVEIQRLAASAWLAHAEHRDIEAQRLMREAADLEDRTDKHPVTPGPVLPARELLGELLMELDRPQEALPEFERTLQVSPRRFNATYGAARAAELSGDRRKAHERYSELMQLCAPSGSARLELQNAARFLQGR